MGDRIKIISNVGLTQILQFIKDGNIQAADVVYDNTYEGYAAVDQLIRVLTGAELYKTPGVTDPRFASTRTSRSTWHHGERWRPHGPVDRQKRCSEALPGALGREIVIVEPRLSVRSLSVRFGTHLALDSLDLDVPPGRSSRSWARTDRASPRPSRL